MVTCLQSAAVIWWVILFVAGWLVGISLAVWLEW